MNFLSLSFLDLDFFSQLENGLLVFDNSCEETFNDKEFSKHATAGRHRNISVIYVKHNLCSFMSFLCECLLNVFDGNVPVNKQLPTKLGEIILTIIIKGNNFEEEAKRFRQKIRNHSSVEIVVLYSIRGPIMHTEELVLIPKRVFVSKNPTEKNILDNPMY